MIQLFIMTDQLTDWALKHWLYAFAPSSKLNHETDLFCPFSMLWSLEEKKGTVLDYVYLFFYTDI